MKRGKSAHTIRRFRVRLKKFLGRRRRPSHQSALWRKEDITMKGDQKICPARRGAPRRQDCPGERAAGEEKRL